jgi:small subunit ribosomal protein S6
VHPYELILIMDPAHGEDKLGAVVTKVEDKIKELGGQIDKTEKWGTKRLQSIMMKAKRLTQGYYVLVRFSAPPATPNQLIAYLKVNEHIIRYLVSQAVKPDAPRPERTGPGRRDIAGTPIDAVAVGEIKGEPLGESK